MNEFLIVLKGQASLTHCDGTLTLLIQHCKGLSFAQELPLRNTWQHVFWKYSPQAKKAAVPYDLSHSKIVNQDIIVLCLESALRKSRAHTMQASLENQVQHLNMTRFPGTLVTSVAQTVLRKVRGTRKAAGVSIRLQGP